MGTLSESNLKLTLHALHYNTFSISDWCRLKIQKNMIA